MAMILAFPEMQLAERREPTRCDKSRETPKPAEIILFPGVRYERGADASADRGGLRETVERDRLQLIE